MEESDQNYKNNGEIDEIMKSNEIREAYHMVVDKLVRANFNTIETNGIDIKQTKMVNLDNSQLEATLIFMIDWFIDTEEYEKCSILQKYLDQLKEA
jgi:hypothetical protein